MEILKKIVITLIIAGTMLVIGYYAYQYFYKEDTEKNINLTYVTVSINPDVQLAINEEKEVEEVITLNDDADILLANLDLEGEDVNDAVETLIDEAIDTGYIDEYTGENSVVLSIASDNEESDLELEEELAGTATEYLNDKEVGAVVVVTGVTDEMKVAATNYGISNGKMLLITKALQLNSSLNETDLVGMTIAQIQEQIKLVVKARIEAKNLTQKDLEQANETKKKQKKDAIYALENKYKEENAEELATMTEKEVAAAVKAYLKDKKTEAKAIVDEVTIELQTENNNSNNDKDKKYVETKDQQATIKEKVKDKVQSKKGE